MRAAWTWVGVHKTHCHHPLPWWKLMPTIPLLLIHPLPCFTFSLHCTPVFAFFHFIQLSDILSSCSDRQVSFCSTIFCYKCSSPFLYPQHIHVISTQHFLTAFLSNRKTLEALVAHPACVENFYFVELVTSHIGYKLEFYYYSRVPLTSHIITWLTSHYVSLTGSERKP